MIKITHAVTSFSIIAILALYSATSTAALIYRGNGMAYDTILNATWLTDADSFSTAKAKDPDLVSKIISSVGSIEGHALTSWDFTGISEPNMTWYGAMAWAEYFSIAGYDDWRLPIASHPDLTCSGQFDLGPDVPKQGYAWGCRNSELGRMFFDNLAGAQGWFSRGDQVTPDGVTLYNIQTIHWFQTGFPETDPPYIQAYNFEMWGYTGFVVKSVGKASPWLIRDGDVAAVPTPPTAAIFLFGLFGLLWRKLNYEKANTCKCPYVAAR
jgi:hypothetical protein